MSTEFYYYKYTMLGDELKAYHALESGFDGVKETISVPKLSVARISQIAEMVKLDRPDIFYVGALSYRFQENSERIYVIPEYLFKKKQIEGLRESISSRAKSILKDASGLDDLHAISFVRDFILRSVTYEKLRKNYSHEVYGVLTNGIGVCEGIAKTVKLLLDMLGIESIVVIGEANEQNFRHAWNIIYLGGKCGHYDFTFDLSLAKCGIKPRYFNLKDGVIFKDHTKTVYEVPKCI